MRRRVSSFTDLNTVFHGCEAVPRQTFDIVEHLVAHAVGTRADDKSHNVFNGESLLILALYVVECAVGVAVSLKVGEVFHVGILACEEPFAPPQAVALCSFRVGSRRG